MLWYECQVCGKTVLLNGEQWLDRGTRLFCPECGEATFVYLSAEQAHEADLPFTAEQLQAAVERHAEELKELE